MKSNTYVKRILILGICIFSTAKADASATQSKVTPAHIAGAAANITQNTPRSVVDILKDESINTHHELIVKLNEHGHGSILEEILRVFKGVTRSTSLFRLGVLRSKLSTLTRKIIDEVQKDTRAKQRFLYFAEQISQA